MPLSPAANAFRLPAGSAGRVITATDSDYDQLRTVMYGGYDKRPAQIVRVADPADTAAAIAFARGNNLELAVRSGGHSGAGHSTTHGGLVIDVRDLQGIEIDAANRTVWVGAGVTAMELTEALAPHQLIVGFGDAGSVGISGITLGGGVGYLARKHGLSIDSLLAVELVTADGRQLLADAASHPELFWALRGGGGNFGVVTSFEFRLDPLGPDVLAGPIVHPMSAAAELLAFWRDFMRTAPDQLQCMPVIFAPPAVDGSFGPTVFALVPLWAGDPADGEAAMAPLREIGSPLADGVALARYATLLFSLDEMYRAGDRNYYRTAFFDDIPDAALAEFARRADPVPTRESSIFLEPLGGAIARRARDATAFPHRERMYCVTAVPKWQDAARDDEMIAWAERLFEPLDAYAAPGAYVNYLDGAGEAQARAAYGEHWDRLVELKRRWDPENLFRSNHNIPPA